MGPKQKGGGSKSRGNATEEVEETLQAVVGLLEGQDGRLATCLLPSYLSSLDT